MFVCSIAHLSFLKLHIFISKGNIMLFQIWPLCQCNVRFRLELSGTHEFYLYWLKCWNRLGFIFVKLWYLKMTLDQNGHCCGIPNPPISPNETHEWLINLCHMALSHNDTTAWLYTFMLSPSQSTKKEEVMSLLDQASIEHQELNQLLVKITPFSGEIFFAEVFLPFLSLLSPSKNGINRQYPSPAYFLT